MKPRYKTFTAYAGAEAADMLNNAADEGYTFLSMTPISNAETKEAVFFVVEYTGIHETEEESARRAESRERFRNRP